MCWFFNHTGTPDLKQIMTDLPHIFFLKSLLALKVKKMLNLILIFRDSGQKISGGYAGNWIFHQNNIFGSNFPKSVHGSQTISGVLIGLK
jgi:hypothetical protein